MKKKTLCVFSFGMKPSHITWETAAAMRACEEIYSSCLDKGTVGYFRRFFSGIKFPAGSGFAETAQAALAALERRDTVGVLTYGNPCFFHPPTVDLIASAGLRGIEVKVFDAVSSLDSMVNMFVSGGYMDDLRLVRASLFTEKSRIAFTPLLDTMFFVLDQLAGKAGAGLRRRFAGDAAGAYPAGAPVFLAACESISGKRSVIRSSVGKLESLLKKAGYRHTLFIPAVKKAARRAAAATGRAGARPPSPGDRRSGEKSLTGAARLFPGLP